MVTAGSVAATVQVWLALAALPTPSVARTTKVWVPLASATDHGEVQGVAATTPTISQVTAAPASATNANAASAWSVGSLGALVISTVVSASTSNVRSAGVRSGPAAARARTCSACGPLGSGPTSCGEVHAVNPASSSAHSKVTAPTSAGLANVNVCGPAATVAVGPSRITVSGRLVSTTHVYSTGLGSGLPAGSTAYTSSVWGPSASGRPSRSSHGTSGPPSSEHWNVAPGSSDSNSKWNVASAVNSGGARRSAVSGAVWSRVQGSSVTALARSPSPRARTASTWAPSTTSTA